MSQPLIVRRHEEFGNLGFAGLPTIISAAGERALFRFVEFFTANIRNPNTRVSYGRAVRELEYRHHGIVRSRAQELLHLQPKLSRPADVNFIIRKYFQKSFAS